MTFSVIIPTLWHSNCLPATLALLDGCPEIDDIILIDNNPTCRQSFESCTKLTIVNCSQNIYVNPAWNRGAKLAKANILCFLNDDLQPKMEVFNFIENAFSDSQCSQIGLIGLDWQRPLGDLRVTPVGWRTTNWFGSMWFIRSIDYSPVPLVRIWGGEDWNMLKQLNRSKILYELSGFSGASQIQLGSTSITALGGLKGSIRWVLKADKYLWALVLKPMLFIDKAMLTLFAFFCEKL